MNCPKCNVFDDMSVLDSRKYVDTIRRRKRCNSCDHRYTTYERIDGKAKQWAVSIVFESETKPQLSVRQIDLKRDEEGAGTVVTNLNDLLLSDADVHLLATLDSKEEEIDE